MNDYSKWVMTAAFGLAWTMSLPLPANAVGEHKGMDHGTMPHAAGNHWTAPPEQAKRKNPIPPDAASIARGQKIYADNCASCHGASGRGDGPAGKALNPKPADLATMAPQHSAGDLAWKVETGRGPMPPWNGVLSANQIWDVVNYMQRLGGKPKARATPTSKSGDAHADHAR